MYRKAQWTYAALAAGLLFGSAQAAALVHLAGFCISVTLVAD